MYFRLSTYHFIPVMVNACSLLIFVCLYVLSELYRVCVCIVCKFPAEYDAHVVYQYRVQNTFVSQEAISVVYTPVLIISVLMLNHDTAAEFIHS